MKDFNFKIYTQLLQSLQNAGFFFQTFAEYITESSTRVINNEHLKGNAINMSSIRFRETPNKKHQTPNKEYITRNTEHRTHNKEHQTPNTKQRTPNNEQSTTNKLIILRHDVEARYENALQMARIQHKMGIRGSYYFRFLPKSYSTEIIKEIADLGHEIGYHYDDLSVCKGNRAEALKRFQQHLKELRKIAPVRTMTMEGAPLSPYDNRDLWKPEATERKKDNGADQQQTKLALRCGELVEPSEAEVNKACTERSRSEHQTPNKQPYHAFGILAEPYFDIDFNKLYYITDTGRRWDGHLYNVRDKATKENPITNPEFLKLRFHNTKDIIKAVENGTFPKQAMLNFHPQRWNDAFLPWVKELLWQNIKNQGKRVLVLMRK